MSENTTAGATRIAVGIFLGLLGLGWFLPNAVDTFRQYERSVTVKGLAEREVPADIVIWPIQFNLANNDLGALYEDLESKTDLIRQFLLKNGIAETDVSVAAPNITDKSAQQYGGDTAAPFRYSAFQTVTVYSHEVETVRSLMGSLSQLGKQGIVLTGGGYQGEAEYIFTRLNDIKPAMIEEATRNAREVAEKFAQDSQSRLGKIRVASQGQFSIDVRDRNNPHIKKIRVVSTVEYYLSD